MGKVVENIRAIRLEKSISQQAIADALNVDVSAISNIENGKRELRVSELENIANVLRVDVIDLFTWPHHYVNSKNVEKDTREKVCVTFEVDPQKRDYLLRLVMGEKIKDE